MPQHSGNKKVFGEFDLHCTDNVVYISYDEHKKLNRYSSIGRDDLGMSFRDWLRPMTFDEQYVHGIGAMKKLEIKYDFGQ